MANTGKQRSLTATINKTLAGVQQEGYPRTYQGKSEFTHNGTTYPAISNTRMATMPFSEYEARLEAFKSYIENLEQGLEFDADTVAGSEAYRVNEAACPIN